jgi:hypothetical protein
MNYTQFKYLKPVLTYDETELKHRIHYIMVVDSAPYELERLEEFNIEGSIFTVPWVLLSAEFVAPIN